MLQCIIDSKGRHVEILQENQTKELLEGQSIVPLSNFYDVLNAERYNIPIWDFYLLKWIGQGEQRPEILQSPSVEERLKNAEETILFLMDMNLGGM